MEQEDAGFQRRELQQARNRTHQQDCHRGDGDADDPAEQLHGTDIIIQPIRIIQLGPADAVGQVQGEHRQEQRIPGVEIDY
ncbi:MAG: hypothetical protein IIT64_11145, partial [Bacteroidaceae bacterium]|nr:hypothetical protein [Bacteroidaceae bacterium]